MGLFWVVVVHCMLSTIIILCVLSVLLSILLVCFFFFKLVYPSFCVFVYFQKLEKKNTKIRAKMF